MLVCDVGERNQAHRLLKPHELNPKPERSFILSS